MTKMGLGIGYITKEFASTELSNQELFPLDITPNIPAREIGIVTLNNVIPSFAAKAFIELIKEKRY